MAAKKYIVLAVALVVTLSVAVIGAVGAFAGGKPPEIPNMSIENTGGVPLAGSTKCKYLSRFQKCQIRLQNNSAFTVLITEVALVGINAEDRYERENGNCTVGTSLARVGGTCTEEVKLKANPCIGWLNWYSIKVEEVGNPRNNVMTSQSLEIENPN